MGPIVFCRQQISGLRSHTMQPYHPSLVHFPVAMAFLIPVISGFIIIYTGKKASLQPLLAIIPISQFFLVIATYAAMFTGDLDRSTIESLIVDQNPVPTRQTVRLMSIFDAHENAARLFFLSTIAGTVLSYIGIKRMGPIRAKSAKNRGLLYISVIFQFLILILCLRTANLGGELVYRHGAADAFKSESLPLQREELKQAETENDTNDASQHSNPGAIQ